jgi:hypothetical protein
LSEQKLHHEWTGGEFFVHPQAGGNENNFQCGREIHSLKIEKKQLVYQKVILKAKVELKGRMN